MAKDRDLYILWTNADLTTTEHMVFMYAQHVIKNQSWRSVNIIAWGATVKLLGENEHVQEIVSNAISNGVKFSVCRACAQKTGVEHILDEKGIYNLIYEGKVLTKILEDDEKLLTI
ncbi:MAG: DsrE family protein [Sphaerochaeta sp.]